MYSALKRILSHGKTKHAALARFGTPHLHTHCRVWATTSLSWVTEHCSLHNHICVYMVVWGRLTMEHKSVELNSTLGNDLNSQLYPMIVLRSTTMWQRSGNHKSQSWILRKDAVSDTAV